MKERSRLAGGRPEEVPKVKGLWQGGEVVISILAHNFYVSSIVSTGEEGMGPVKIMTILRH